MVSEIFFKTLYVNPYKYKGQRHIKYRISVVFKRHSTTTLSTKNKDSNCLKEKRSVFFHLTLNLILWPELVFNFNFYFPKQSNSEFIKTHVPHSKTVLRVGNRPWFAFKFIWSFRLKYHFLFWKCSSQKKNTIAVTTKMRTNVYLFIYFKSGFF